MTQRTIIAVSFMIAWGVTLAQTSRVVGSITGTVVNEAGTPMPGAKVLYGKLSEYTRDRNGRPVLSASGFGKAVTSGSSGRFVLAGLPGGRYEICAYGSQPNQVGSCDWSGVGVVQLAAGQSVQNIIRTIYEGTVVTVRAADPNRKAAIPDSKGKVARERRFSIGLTAESGFYRGAERVSDTATEHVFRITIPKRQSMRLFIDSELKVADSAGNNLETRQPTSQRIPVAASDQVTVNLVIR